MTYKDGTEAKVGDRLLFPFHEWKSATPGGIPTGTLCSREGVLYAIFDHTPTSNGRIAYADFEKGEHGGGEQYRLLRLVTSIVTLAECLPVSARP